MRGALMALACLMAVPVTACVSATPTQTQWGRQARIQCDRQPDPRSRGECYRRVEEAERNRTAPPASAE